MGATVSDLHAGPLVDFDCAENILTEPVPAPPRPTDRPRQLPAETSQIPAAFATFHDHAVEPGNPE